MNGHLHPRRRNLGLALIVAGLVALIAGWFRSGDSHILADQVSFIASGAIGGVAMILAGLALVASANSRHEAVDRLARIEAAIRHQQGDHR